MLFRSAVDVWWYLFVLCAPLAVVRVVALPLASAHSAMVSLIVAAVLPLLILPTWLLFTTYYQIDADALKVRSGPFSWVVALDQIHDVTKVTTLAVSPALSQDRLKITYGRGQSIIVSPQRKAAFLTALGYRPATVLQPQKHRPNPFALGENY